MTKTQRNPLIGGVTILNSMGSMTFDDYIVESIDLGRKGYYERNLELAIEQMKSHISDGVLLLEGGADINPALYNQANRTSYFNDGRDKWEIDLYNAARELGIPVIGICRGHQLMAALNGGSLYQDIHQELRVDHSNGYANCFGVMQEWYGKQKYFNSLHHQAVKDIPANAVLIAQDEDGVIEGLAYPNDRMISFQGHPELSDDVELLFHMLEYIGMRVTTSI